MSQDIVIQGYLSYPHLFEARQVNGQGNHKFSANVILDPSFDWAPFTQAYQEAIAAKWPQGAPANLRVPFDTVQEGPYAGHNQIKASTVDHTTPPQIVMQNPAVKAGPHQAGSFFPGALVNVYIRVHGYDTMGNGVRCHLNAVQLVSDDPSLPRLDNQKAATEVFQQIAGAPAATADVPGGMPVSGQHPGQMPAQGTPQGQPAGFPAGATQQPGIPAGAAAPQQGYAQTGGPASGYQPAAPAGGPGMTQGPAGAGVPTGAPAGAQQPQQGQPQQGMPWNQ